MSHEIELKLALPQRALPALRRHALVAAAQKLGTTATLDNTYFSQTARAEATFVAWKRLVVRANADYNYYKGITDTFLEERLICNAMLGVKLFRNCLGEASVGVNDILDQNGTTFRRTVSGTTLRNVTNLAVGRYVSFQFTYNLRLFRSQSNAVMDALQGK